MLFHVIDHGGWLSKFGIRRRMVRWIFGNPLIAITMIRHDLTAGLSAPVEILVTEAEDGLGTTITYVRPSSLMVMGNNPSLMQAAERKGDRDADAHMAPATSSQRKCRLPCLEILPSRSFPPVECCLGTKPIQAARLRPDENVFQSPTSVPGRCCA